MYPTQVFALRWLASAATPPFPMQQLLLPGGTLLEQHARRHAGDWTEGGEKLFFMKPVESRRVGWAEENMHRRKLTTTYNGLNETQRSAVRCPSLPGVWRDETHTGKATSWEPTNPTAKRALPADAYHFHHQRPLRTARHAHDVTTNEHRTGCIYAVLPPPRLVVLVAADQVAFCM